MLECDFSISKNASTPEGLMNTSQSTGPSPITLENSLRIPDCSSGRSSTAWMMNGVHPSPRTNLEVSSPLPTGRVIAMDFSVGGVLDIDSPPSLCDLFRSLPKKFFSCLSGQLHSPPDVSRPFREKFFLTINREYGGYYLDPITLSPS